MEEGTVDSISTPSPLGRVMNTLFGSRPRQLEATISRIASSFSSRSGSGGLLEESLCFLRRHVNDAVKKEEPLDDVLIPMIEHLLKFKGSKNCKQVLILVNWFYQDELLHQALRNNLASIIMTKEDHFITYGWCALVANLVELTTREQERKQEKDDLLVDILCQSFSRLVFIMCEKSIMQGEYELPTRLSIAVADCTLLLIETLAEAAIHKKKSSALISGDLLVMLKANTAKGQDSAQRSHEGFGDMEMEWWLCDHLDELVIIVQTLQAWSRKSRPLHAMGLAQVLKWLKEIKPHYDNLQAESGENLLESGKFLCFCWKHYAFLMRLEDQRFSLRQSELLEQYISGIQHYTQIESDNHVLKQSSKFEMRIFFLNCLCLLLGRLGGKQLEVVRTEHGPRLLDLLFSQLQYDDEDRVEVSLSLLRAIIFKGNFPSGGRLLETTQMEMDAVLPLLLSFLDERDSIAKAVVLLYAECCSLKPDGQGLQEIFRRLEFGNPTQKKNAIDVISELIHISSDSDMRQEITKHVQECLRDDVVMTYMQESELLQKFDPHLILPALVRLVCSENEELRFSASNAIITVLRCHNKISTVIFAMLDSLSDFVRNPSLAYKVGGKEKSGHSSSMQCYTGQKLDVDRVLGLIPKWSESVQNWKSLIEQVIDKMFQDPSNAVIVRFMSYISENLGDAVDIVFHHVRLHMLEQKKVYESWSSGGIGTLSSDDSAQLRGSVFDHLCPLLLLRVLPLRVYDNLCSPALYGNLYDNLEAGTAIFIEDDDCIAALLVNRAFDMFEFEDVRKLAADLCGHLHPQVLLPITELLLKHATQSRDILKIKTCLFVICTSLVVREKESASHPVMSRIRKLLEMVLSWPSLDSHEVSKAQHGCIDCLALMICTDVKATGTSEGFFRNNIGGTGYASCSGASASTTSILNCVVKRLTCDECDSMRMDETRYSETGCDKSRSHGTSPSTSDLYSASIAIQYRLCMANVLISAFQKVSTSGKHQLAREVLPSLICSIEAISCSDVRAACLQVLFSAVCHLKSSVLPFASSLINLTVKALKKGLEKEQIAAAKLMMSLMASDDEIIESIAGGLLEAKPVLEDVGLNTPSLELQQLCRKLLACVTSPLDNVFGY